MKTLKKKASAHRLLASKELKYYLKNKWKKYCEVDGCMLTLCKMH